MDDQKIVELYFFRSEQAIKETDIKYGKLCRSIAYNILQNDEDAEECVDDTYIGVWNTIPPKKPDNFMAFVCKIARNLALKRLESETRQKRSQATVISISELEEILPDESIAADVSNEEIGKLISNFLRKEKADIRKVFIRKYYFFDSVSEIAERYGFTESKVKNMLYHTRNKLKEYLIKEGIEI
ncbi:MAG: sigma-70 family RNA polymerase sigma factor [Ruminococcaceae bacterium]|nr:sigma-70 family RNA polymerase sigma factor [Oscillospiraceae bacterium]